MRRDRGTTTSDEATVAHHRYLVCGGGEATLVVVSCSGGILHRGLGSGGVPACGGVPSVIHKEGKRVSRHAKE